MSDKEGGTQFKEESDTVNLMRFVWALGMHSNLLCHK